MRFFKGIFLLMALFISIGSCQNKKTTMNWELTDFNKIPGETPFNTSFNAIGKYKFQQILPVGEKDLLLIGNNERGNDDEKPPKKSEAVVFTSADGGKTLKKHILGAGDLTEAVHNGNTVFLVNENAPVKGSSQLVRADLTFEKWEVVQEFEHEQINNINFYSTTVGMASFLTESPTQQLKSEIKYTADGGKSWKTTDLQVSGGLGPYLFVSPEEIQFIENNQLIKFNFVNGLRTVVNARLAPDQYTCEGNYFKDPVTADTYTYVLNETTKALSLKNLRTQELVAFPKGSDDLQVYGDFLYTMVKDDIYYNYVWSEDKGKTWNKEELREFFVIPAPIAYFGKGGVYAFVNCFKGKEEERGGRFATRKPNH